MKKNSTKLEKKIARYTAFAGAVLAAGSADAQISYYDINPDYDINNATAAFDLNGDSQADVVFRDTSITQTSQYWIQMMAPLNTSMAFAGDSYTFTTSSGSSTAYYPFKLNFGDPIDGTLSWVPGTGVGSTTPVGDFQVLVNGTHPGSWSSHWVGGITDGYLPIRLDAGSGNMMYGWMRIDITADGQHIILKDLGINMTPNQAINAGDMGNVGINTELASNVNIYAYNDILNININGDLNSGNISVISMNGAVVLNETVNGTRTFDISSLSTGIYTVQAVFETGVVTKKIFVK